MTLRRPSRQRVKGVSALNVRKFPSEFPGISGAKNGSELTRIKRWGVECMAWREPFKAGSRKGACRGGIDARIDPTLRETGPDPPALSVRILFGQGCEPKARRFAQGKQAGVAASDSGQEEWGTTNANRTAQ